MFFDKIWAALCQLLKFKTYTIPVTTVMSTEENNLVYSILDNGHDYEVKVEKSGILIYHCVGFETMADAHDFIDLYQRNVVI